VNIQSGLWRGGALRSQSGFKIGASRSSITLCNYRVQVEQVSGGGYVGGGGNTDQFIDAV